MSYVDERLKFYKGGVFFENCTCDNNDAAQQYWNSEYKKCLQKVKDGQEITARQELINKGKENGVIIQIIIEDEFKNPLMSGVYNEEEWDVE